MSTEKENPKDVAAVEAWGSTYQTLTTELGKTIVGQRDVIEHMVVAMLANGHALLEGVPGLAKTLMVHSIADAMGLSFNRIQFTPDLMPSDITGTDVLRDKKTEFVKGPIFANLVLADEINRTPPETQAAMLEAMQERMVSAGGTDYQLPAPFFVLATQNPLEQEGTYPLPEAQLDRFLLYIKVAYPDPSEEWDIARRVTSGSLGGIQGVIKPKELLASQELVKRMPACDQVVGYAMALVRATRPSSEEAPSFVKQYVSWARAPAGVLALIKLCKARALIHGRYHASVEDVKAVVAPTLRHRVAPNYAALAAGINSEKLVEMLMEAIPADKEYKRPEAAA